MAEPSEPFDEPLEAAVVRTTPADEGDRAVLIEQSGIPERVNGRCLMLRQREIPALPANCYTSKQIAAWWFVSLPPWNVRMSDAMKRPGATSRAHLMALALTERTHDPLVEQKVATA